jgi:DNA modification methylase
MADVFTLHRADARHLNRLMRRAAAAANPDDPEVPFITATVTSPPYGKLVNYGVDRQIGFGQTDAEYLDDCRKIFGELHRWTKDDGCLWLVVDNYHLRPPGQRGGISRLNPLPFTLAGLAEAEGWVLRDVIIWHKDRTRPWTHHGKLRNAFEYVLLLVKTSNFKFSVDRLRDSQELARWWVRYPERYHTHGKAPDNVWHIPIPTQGSWAKKAYQHACPLPTDLVRRILLLSTDEGDVVCDPFSGIGTVPSVAEAMGRRPIGAELNPDFVAHYRKHVRAEVRELIKAADSDDSRNGPTPETIAKLRALKYPKAMFSRFRQIHHDLPLPSLAIVDITSVRAKVKRTEAVVTADWLFVTGADAATREQMQAIMKDLSRRTPLSKFGVSGDIRVVGHAEARRMLGERSWHLYEHGRTWQSTRELSADEVMETPISALRGAFPPVAGSHRIDINLNFIGDTASDDPTR